jgi:hypothetical protein
MKIINIYLFNKKKHIKYIFKYSHKLNLLKYIKIKIIFNNIS